MSADHRELELQPPLLAVAVMGHGREVESLTALLQGLERLGNFVVFVQHSAPPPLEALAERLRRTTTLTVSPAHDGEPEADTVYLVPADVRLTMADGRMVLGAAESVGPHALFDRLLSGLAGVGPRAAAVLFHDDTSPDGAGRRLLRDAGGLVVAQRSETAPSAPPAGVDLVLPVERIAEALARFRRVDTATLADHGPRHATAPASGSAGFGELLTEDVTTRLQELLERNGHLHLQSYKPGTVSRRVWRRMALGGYRSPGAYLDDLEVDVEEQAALLRDLMISVTDFFRDPSAFQALRESVIDPLMAAVAERATLRAWVAGCATGEEAYTLAMQLLDAAHRTDKPVDVQVFATDVDESALATARAGIYAASLLERVPPRLLRDYFDPVDDDRYRVTRRLRDAVAFARHDLTRDPPFSRMDLVTCRNVLIYLRPGVQQRVLRMLHFALNPGGTLLLGLAESATATPELFESVADRWRIYRRLEPTRRVPPPRTAPTPAPRGATGMAESRPGRTRTSMARGDAAALVVMQARVPPTVVVEENGSVLYMHGELRPFLRFPEGQHPELQLSTLVTSALATRARAALYRCRRDRETVTTWSSPADDDTAGRIRITATPAFELGNGAVVLSFEEISDSAPAAAAPTEAADGTVQQAIIEELEQELEATREDLRNTVEELETTNEELRSANEEAISINEELQSASEELEATAEELRSLNGELTHANTQLRAQLDELGEAHDDLANFFSSTKIATVFLDEQLRIKRFTPAAEAMLDLSAEILGRHVRELGAALLDDDLEAQARAVLENLGEQVAELRTDTGRWISRQVLPYRTAQRRIEGVVVTLADVTELKLATGRLEEREREQAVIARLGLRALREPDLALFLDQAVREVQQALDVDACKVLELLPNRQALLLRAGVGWNEGLVGRVTVSAGLDSQAGFTLMTGQPVVVTDLASERRFSGPELLTEHGLMSGLSCEIRHGEGLYGVLGAHARPPRSFTEQDSNFLQAVAAVIGSAVASRQARVRLGVRGAVARALAEADSAAGGLARTLERLLTELDGCVAEYWRPAGDATGLTCELVAVRPPLRKREVEQGFSRRPLEPGEGLVGRVAAEATPAWFSDLADPGEFSRIEEARALGLCTGLAFPVLSGSDVLGVVTLFSRKHLIPDPLLAGSLDMIGRMLGEFLVGMAREDRAHHIAAIAEASHDAIISYDFDGIVTEWLGGAERLYGYTASEMVGQSLEHIVPADRRDELAQLNVRLWRGDVPEPLETQRLRKDGIRVEVSVRAAIIRDHAGRLVGVSSTDRDIGAQKAAERQLVEADRQKDEFLAMLGHELRNPLAAIRSATDLLQAHAEGDARLARTHAILERQTRHMAKLLDGLLDVSRIVRGQINLEREAVDLAALCRELAEEVKQRIARRNLSWHANLPAAPVWVDGDRIRLTQVVDNLLSNAIKYTPDGGALRLSLAADAATTTVTVTDTGVGIPPDLLPHVFGVFRQAEQSLDRSLGGLGLGLPLVKSLVELHHGSIRAESDGPGRGARFVVELPRGAPPAPAEPAQAAATRPLDIVLIEDNRDSAEALKSLLELWGHRLTVAGTGNAGVEAVMSRAGEVDVVLCDIGLPQGMSGYDVARILRRDPATRHVTLVALTGYGRPEDKARCFDAGFDRHVTKPLDIDAIQELLDDAGQSATN